MRDIDRVIDFVRDMDTLSDTMKQVIISRLEVKPEPDEIERARATLASASEGRRRVYALRTSRHITFYEVRANDPAQALAMTRKQRERVGDHYGPLTIVTRLDATNWEEVPDEQQ